MSDDLPDFLMDDPPPPPPQAAPPQKVTEVTPQSSTAEVKKASPQMQPSENEQQTSKRDANADEDPLDFLSEPPPPPPVKGAPLAPISPASPAKKPEEKEEVTQIEPEAIVEPSSPKQTEVEALPSRAESTVSKKNESEGEVATRTEKPLVASAAVASSSSATPTATPTAINATAPPSSTPPRKSKEERAAEDAQRRREKEEDAKASVDVRADSLFSQAMGIRARHLEALNASRMSGNAGGGSSTSAAKSRGPAKTPEPKRAASRQSSSQQQKGRAHTSSGNYEDDEDDDDNAEYDDDDEEDLMDRVRRKEAENRNALPKPKYSYLSPEHLLKHEEELREERLQAKRDRHRNEQIRLRNLAIARQREQQAKDKQYEDALNHYSLAAIKAEQMGPDIPTHDVNVTTTRNSKIKGRLWFPSGRHGGRDSQHKPPLGYGALPPPTWIAGGYGSSVGFNANSMNNSASASPAKSSSSQPQQNGMNSSSGGNYHNASLGNTSTSALNRTANSSSRKGNVISPLQPFDEDLFETITMEKVKRREEAEHGEKWDHIRLIQQKRAESVKVIEEKKRERQRAIEEQLKQDVVAAQSDKDQKRNADQQFAFEMRNLDRQRRQKISAYKEERAKAVLKNALQLRMEALRRAEDQQRYDREVKKTERTAADRQRAAYLLALQEERDKHETRLAEEGKLRTEIEARTRDYNFQQEQKRLENRKARLARVDRQIEDKLTHREKEAAMLKEKQYEADHMYSTLLKVKRPLVVESRGDTSITASTSMRGSSRGGGQSGGSYNHNSTLSAIDDDLAQADRENKALREYYHVKA